MTEAMMVDLRSDAVTRPTEAMRSAMAAAVVGDDSFGEDPTVNALEARVAAMLGKEAAVFLPSGTMANLIAAVVHCRERGSELLCGDKSHMYLCEQGGASQLAGVMMSTLRTLDDGTFDLTEVAARVRGSRPQDPQTKLLVIENTHNLCGGKVISAEWTEAAGEVCRRAGLALHLDGARLWNASEELRCDPDSLARPADSVSVCFDKGLGAPVGSVLAGSTDFIARARRARKALGGGMRQAGVLAAAALVALDEQLPALYSDHRRALFIANGVRELRLSRVWVDVATNMVMLRVEGVEGARLVARLALVSASETAAGVLAAGGRGVVVRALAVETGAVRLVLHHEVHDDHARLVVTKLGYVLRELTSK